MAAAAEIDTTSADNEEPCPVVRLTLPLDVQGDYAACSQQQQQQHLRLRTSTTHGHNGAASSHTRDDSCIEEFALVHKHPLFLPTSLSVSYTARSLVQHTVAIAVNPDDSRYRYLVDTPGTTLLRHPLLCGDVPLVATTNVARHVANGCTPVLSHGVSSSLLPHVPTPLSQHGLERVLWLYDVARRVRSATAERDDDDDDDDDDALRSRGHGKNDPDATAVEHGDACGCGCLSVAWCTEVFYRVRKTIQSVFCDCVREQRYEGTVPVLWE